MWNLQVLRHFHVPRHVGHHQKHDRDNHRASDCQPVKAVGHVHRVGTSHQCQNRQQQANADPRVDRVFVERNHHHAHQIDRGRELAVGQAQFADGRQLPKVEADEQRQRGLHPQLHMRSRAAAALLDDLRVIVVKPQRGKHDHRKQTELYQRVPLRPKQRRQVQHRDDQNAPHRRCPFFA